MKKYSEQYDSYYDYEKDVWLEDKCSVDNCSFCRDRPIRPSQI